MIKTSIYISVILIFVTVMFSVFDQRMKIMHEDMLTQNKLLAEQNAILKADCNRLRHQQHYYQAETVDAKNYLFGLKNP